MFKLIKEIIFGKATWDGNPETHPYATATTPEQLIEAAVLQSIAKEFEKWSTQGDTWPWKSRNVQYPCDRKEFPDTFNLINRSKQIQCVAEVTWELDIGMSGSMRYGPTYSPKLAGFKVNGADVGILIGSRILYSFNDVREKIRKAEAEAAAALLRQQEHEKKWNVAETLLGMKRNEFGALVSKEQ